MDQKEAEKLIVDWTAAVTELWQQVIAKAKAGRVGVPLVSEMIGGVKVIMSARGIEVVLGSTGTRFIDLLNTPEFKVSDFVPLRKFVVDSIRKAHVDIEKSIEDRADAFGTAFNEMKREIAEWNLTCERGKEMGKP